MAARMFSEDQLEQLQSFPDIGKDDLIRCAKLLEKGTRTWSGSPRPARNIGTNKLVTPEVRRRQRENTLAMPVTFRG